MCTRIRLIFYTMKQIHSQKTVRVNAAQFFYTLESI